MSMTTQEAFRMGFLNRLAERGFTPSQFEKAAAESLNPFSMAYDVVAKGVETGLKGIETLGPYAVLAGVGLPVGVGIATGSAHAGLEDVSKEDIERMKQRDIIDVYRDEATRIRHKLNREKIQQKPQRVADSF